MVSSLTIGNFPLTTAILAFLSTEQIAQVSGSQSQYCFLQPEITDVRKPNFSQAFRLLFLN